jgi:hypothetical protein
MPWDFYSGNNGFCNSSITFLTGFICGLYKDFYKDQKGIQGYSTGLAEGFYNRFSKVVLSRFRRVLNAFEWDSTGMYSMGFL